MMRAVLSLSLTVSLSGFLPFLSTVEFFFEFIRVTFLHLIDARYLFLRKYLAEFSVVFLADV